MRITTRPFVGAILPAALLAFVATCSRGHDGDDSPSPGANRAPEIQSFTATPSTLLGGQSSDLVVTATDPDGDTLIYAWSATGGAISGSGAQATWTAPVLLGSCTLKVIVSDGQLTKASSLVVSVVSPNAWLAGSFSFAGFEHDYANSHHVAVTGTIDFDGAGAYTNSMTVNADGTIESQASAATYTVTAGGEVTVDDGSGAILAGGLDAAHEAVVLARVTPTGSPLIVVAVERSGSYAQGSLSGDYHVAAYHWDPGGDTPAYAALTGVGTFDAVAGAFDFTATNNWGGTVYQVSASMDYSVASDGTLTMTDPINPANQLNGGVMTGGDIMVAATTGSGNKPMMLVAIRKSGTFAAATMAGSHRTVSIGPSAAGVSSWTGERAFDGVDAWTAGGTLNDNGAVSSTSMSGSYGVTTEGRLTMTAVPRVFELGVREGGKAAAGAVVSGGELPRFVFSVRK